MNRADLSPSSAATKFMRLTNPSRGTTYLCKAALSTPLSLPHSATDRRFPAFPVLPPFYRQFTTAPLLAKYSSLFSHSILSFFLPRLVWKNSISTRLYTENKNIVHHFFETVSSLIHVYQGFFSIYISIWYLFILLSISHYPILYILVFHQNKKKKPSDKRRDKEDEDYGEDYCRGFDEVFFVRRCAAPF